MYLGFQYQILGGGQEFDLYNITSSNVNCSVVYSYSTDNTTLTNSNSKFGLGYSSWNN